MKIVDIDVWTVVVPERPGSVDSPEWGRQDWPDVPKQIVRISPDEGLSGIGETHRGLSTAAVLKSARLLEGRAVMKMRLQNVFLTRSLSLPSRASGEPEMDLGPYPPGYDAFEMAVFDLIGQRLGVPVHALLGGAVRDRVTLSMDILLTARTLVCRGRFQTCPYKRVDQIRIASSDARWPKPAKREHFARKS